MIKTINYKTDMKMATNLLSGIYMTNTMSLSCRCNNVMVINDRVNITVSFKCHHQGVKVIMPTASWCHYK